MTYDSQRFCQTHKPFLSSPLSHSLPHPLRFQASRCGKKQPVLKMGHPRGVGQASGISGQPTALEDTISHRDTFWLPVGILAQWKALSRINRFLVRVFSPQMGMNARSSVSSVLLIPTQIQTFASSCSNDCIGPVYKCCGIFFFKVKLWPRHLFSTA